MPIEIKELHIKATVGNGDKQPTPAAANNGNKDTQDALIAACVEQVLQVLEDRKER